MPAINPTRTRAGPGGDELLTFMGKDSSEGTLVADAELEAPTAAGVRAVRDRNTIIQPQGTHLGNVDSQTQAPVVVVDPGAEKFRVKAVCILIDHTDVVEHCKA